MRKYPLVEGEHDVLGASLDPSDLLQAPHIPSPTPTQHHNSGRTYTENDSRSCVRVEVAVLGCPS